MATPSISKLLEQGYMITDANTIYAGEAWEIENPLLAMFDTAFLDLRTAQALCENIRIEKEAQVKRTQNARIAIEHALTRLKRYAYVVATQEFAETMFHTLGIDDDYPNKDEDFVTKLMSTVLPHLGDWDGTPEEISAAIKTEVIDATTEYADAVRDNVETQAQSESATADRDDKRDAYEDVLTRVRNFLYLMLPKEREDQRLEEYGFEVWGGETPEPGQLPAVENIVLNFVDPNLTVSWDAVEGATGYVLQMGNNPNILSTTLYRGPDTSFTFDPPGGHPHYFRVWALDGEEWGERGEAVSIEIEGTPPLVPKQLKVVRDGDYLKWEWKSGGDVPEYFRLFIATVPTGSAPPSRPDEPDTDELITLTVSTFAPGMGNTVYGWITAFGDGEESDPEGPVSIDIV